MNRQLRVEHENLRCDIIEVIRNMHVTGIPDCPGPVPIPRHMFRRWLQFGETPSIVIPHRRGSVTVALVEAR